MGPAARRSTRPPWPEVTSEDPSRSRVHEGDSHRRFLYEQTADSHADAYWTWTLSACGAHIVAVTHVDTFFHHHGCVPEGPCFAPTAAVEVMWSVSARRD